MQHHIHPIENNVQDYESEPWHLLCRYIDHIADTGKRSFSPMEFMGRQLFAEIYTLPRSIAKLTKVSSMNLYGSSLKRIPPEIGKMEALEYFDPYTSYNLHWFPYEITHCKNLKQSRVSTRATYGNEKNNMPFPNLRKQRVLYDDPIIKCSRCGKVMPQVKSDQYWISLRVGTDRLPLLANCCSDACVATLGTPPVAWLPYAHKGGKSVKDPDQEALQADRIARDMVFIQKDGQWVSLRDGKTPMPSSNSKEVKPLKLIKNLEDAFDENGNPKRD